MKSGACAGGWVTRRLPACCSAWLPQEPGSSSRYVPWGLMLGGSANPAGEETPQPRAGRQEHSPRAQHRGPWRGSVQSASPRLQLCVEERSHLYPSQWLFQASRDQNNVIFHWLQVFVILDLTPAQQRLSIQICPHSPLPCEDRLLGASLLHHRLSPATRHFPPLFPWVSP